MFSLFCWPKSSPAIVGRGLAPEEAASPGKQRQQSSLSSPPPYRPVRREGCLLLQYCWEQQWDLVVRRCQTHPQEAYCITQDHGRTALHMAAFSPNFPVSVAETLLKVNRHMIYAVDRHGMTPMHHICHLKGSEDLISLFCRELYKFMPKNDDDDYPTAAVAKNAVTPQLRPPLSPLWYAAKRGSTLKSLKILLATAKTFSWIGPRTGGEAYFIDDEKPESLRIGQHGHLRQWASPLSRLLAAHEFEEMFDQLHKTTRANRDGNTEDDNSNGEIVSHDDLKRVLRNITKRRLGQAEEEKQRAQDKAGGIDRLFSMISSEDDNSDVSDYEDAAVHQHMRIICLWRKCLEFLMDHCPVLKDSNQHGDGSNNYDDDTIGHGIVHAVVCANLRVLLPFVLWLFPEQLLQYDERGLLPLHHAIRLADSVNDCSMIPKLLRFGPQALVMATKQDQPDDSGATPLCLALQGGTIPAPLIFKLLSTGTSSASIPCDGLYPFAVAAAQDCDLTIIYTLLRASPHVLGHFMAPSEETKQSNKI